MCWGKRKRHSLAPCAIDVAGEEDICLDFDLVFDLVFDWMSSLIYGIMMLSN
jgi:hypothetical protein